MSTVPTATTPLSSLREAADTDRGEWLVETAIEVRSRFADVTDDSIPTEAIREIRRPLDDRNERYRPAPNEAFRPADTDVRTAEFRDAILDGLDANHVLIATDTVDGAPGTEPLGALAPGERPLRQRTPPIRFRVLDRCEDGRWIVTPERDDRWYFLERSRADGLTVRTPDGWDHLGLAGVRRAPRDEPLERWRCPCCRMTMALRPTTLRRQYHCSECGLVLETDWTWYHVACALAGASTFPRLPRRPAPVADLRPELRDALRSLPDSTLAD